MQYLLFIFIILVAIKRPMIGLAIISQIYLIKSLLGIGSGVNCITDCLVESDPIFGALLPAIVFFIMISSVIVSKKNTKILYSVDNFDYLGIFFIIIVLLGCLYSPDTAQSLNYLIKFLLKAMCFFYVTKFYLLNQDDKYKSLKDFFIGLIYIAIVLFSVAIYFNSSSHSFIFRLTIPGTHPIPFSLFVGQIFLLSFANLVTRGKIIKIDNSKALTLNFALTITSLIVQFLTNTRGVTIAMIFSSLILLFYFSKNQNFSRILLILICGIIITIPIVNYIGVDILFSRFMRIATDRSFSDRTLAYIYSIELLNSHTLFGTGTNSFSYYSPLAYPHNFILENLVSFGMLGLINSIFFVTFIIKSSLLSIRIGKQNITFFILNTLIIFFFIEAMFSLAIWMHSQLFLYIALANVYKRKPNA